MSNPVSRSFSKLHLLLLLAAPAAVLADAPQFPQLGPDIYDTKASGAADIDKALIQAKASGKRVIVDFGANWCGWCRKLEQMFTTNANVKKMLDENFIVVAVDVNTQDGEPRNADVVARYGNPVRFGLPVLVVLDSDGKQLATQDTGKLENGKDAHEESKVMAFLKEWAPARK